MTMKKTEFRRAIDAVGLSQVKASSFFEVSRKTSPRWARGEAPIPGAVAKLLRVMVHRSITPEEVDELGKISPEEVDKYDDGKSVEPGSLADDGRVLGRGHAIRPEWHRHGAHDSFWFLSEQW